MNTATIDLFDLPKEDLANELSLALEHHPNGMIFIKHPLVTTLYHEPLNASYNALLKHQKERLAEHVAAQEWDQAVWVHERPWRLHAFLRYAAPFLPAHAAGDLLFDVWKDTEFPYTQRLSWLGAFRKYGSQSPIMKRSRAHLPSVSFVVYRGASKLEGTRRRAYGMSWTLERKTAEWFANRFTKDGIVHELHVEPRNVFCYAPERGEQEVVIDPSTLTR